MNYKIHTNARPAFRVERLPWLMFLFLAAVFFLISYDLSFAKMGTGVYSLSMDDVTANIAEGSLTRQIALLSLGLVAIVSLVRHRIPLKVGIDGLLGWALLGFVVWAFLSPIWATNITLTLKRLVIFAILCIAAVAVARQFSLRAVILWTFFTSATFLAIGVFAELYFGTFTPFAPDFRFAGTVHPNIQGMNCGLLLLSATAAAEAEKRHQVLFRAGALLGFAFLILTGSRTTFASVLLALAAYYTSISSFRGKIVGIMAAATLSIALWAAAVMGGNALHGLKNIVMLGRDASTIDSFSGRTLVWEDLEYYINRHPILGCGYGGFWTSTQVNLISGEEGWPVPDSQSTYIDCLLTLGEVGLVGYVLFLFAGIRRAFQLRRLSQNSAFAFCGALLMFCALDGLLESRVMTPSFLMFLFMVVLAQLAFIHPQEANLVTHATSSRKG